ncbi:MAG: glycosyltransferase family 2 protein, partial [Halobacteriales archaeon]|nr:glycosyltransferase family 2 protein [Halobacteriales archaeon]
RAYKVGFGHAQGDVVVTADADGTYPLDRAHEFVDRLLAEGLDFVNCDRYGNLRRGAMSFKHKFGNMVLSTTAQALFLIRLRDSQSGMWVIRSTALRKVDYERLSDGMAFSQELKIEFWKRPGMNVAELPASLGPRIGKPQLSSWRDGLKNLRGLYRLRFTRHW